MSFSKVVPTINRLSKKYDQIQGIPLTALEYNLLNEKWEHFIHASYITTFHDLQQLLSAIQVPVQPTTEKVCTEMFNSTKGRFSFRDMVVLLGKCKALHSAWMYKMRGHQLDDDLVEAFVAVGGLENCGGCIDVEKMRLVISEFHLNVDIDKIIMDIDSDGSNEVDFGEFAMLIRQQNTHKSAAHAVKDEAAEAEDLMIALESEDLGGKSPAQTTAPDPIIFSSHYFVDDDGDFDLLRVNRSPRELSMEAQLSRGGSIMMRQGSMLRASVRGPLGVASSRREGNRSMRLLPGVNPRGLNIIGEVDAVETPQVTSQRKMSAINMKTPEPQDAGQRRMSASSVKSTELPRKSFFKGGGGLRSMNVGQGRRSVTPSSKRPSSRK